MDKQTIHINNHEFSREIVQDLIERVLWKQTATTTNTVDGCQEISKAITAWLIRLGRDGYVPELDALEKKG